jgi:hypothetical protein
LTGKQRALRLIANFKSYRVDQATSPWRLIKDVLIQELISEFSLRVRFLAQSNELRRFFVYALQFARRGREQLSPMRARVERGQFSFDDRQQLAHSWTVRFPRGRNTSPSTCATSICWCLGLHPMAMTISNTVKSIQDIMRQDSGVDGDAQRISQLCRMFFLKSSTIRTSNWADAGGPSLSRNNGGGVPGPPIPKESQERNCSRSLTLTCSPS